MKKQVYTSILVSLALLLSSSRPVNAQSEVVSGGAPVAFEPGPAVPASAPAQAAPQPLLGGMKYNDVTNNLTVDLPSLNSAMNAAHKIMGIQIFSLQDNPMTGYIAIDGQKVANYTLVKNIPQDNTGVVLGQLNNYYLLVNNDDFAKLYQAKLFVMADQLKSGVKKNWQQKMQQAGTDFGKKLGGWLQNLGKKMQQGTTND